MITITSDKINTFSQISYNEFLGTINFHQLSCSCGLTGSLIRHGTYRRSIKTPDGILRICILRLKCKHCGRTHAIFPKLIVPYSQMLLTDHISIIKAYIAKTPFEIIMVTNEYIDESNIRYIIGQYLRHWKERIAAFVFSIKNDIRTLSEKCLCTFKKQLMQIKCTPNILFC
ncbi:MAG: DUF6431 domain-containing protein [Firmicutes bacterium]|nr:DUF6431 domain-containing protein [Bacillota bacterium]